MHENDSKTEKPVKEGAQGQRNQDANAPVSFLDDTWSWASPSTWPLSIRFLPFPITFIVLFFGVYIQHFLFSSASCTSAFDYQIPITKIEALATTLATHDWEQGAAAEALLELHDPEYSVFGERASGGDRNVLKTKALKFVLPKIQLDQITLSNNTFGVADPASLGVFAMLAASADDSFTHSLNPYKKATERQARYLMTDAPRYANGAVSHRIDVAELWSDAMFMFPPFMVYHMLYTFGPTGRDVHLTRELQQIELYRDVLIITKGENKGAWRHIVGPSEMADPGAWSTGNGWAAYGMARVRATIAGWEPGAHLLRQQTAALDGWIAEIIDAAIRTDDHDSGLLRNYLGDDAWFGETAGTALIAAAAYRLAGFLEPGDGRRAKYAAWAGKKREAVFAHVDGDGIARPAVNSLKHGQREPFEGVNPEGESFLLLLAAAWRDCVCSEVCER